MISSTNETTTERGGGRLADPRHSALLFRCPSTWNLAVNLRRNRMRGCCCASADGAKAVRVPASGRWRMKWKANGKLASKFLVVFIGVRSETFDWRGCVPQGVRKQRGFDPRLLTRTRGLQSNATGESVSYIWDLMNRTHRLRPNNDNWASLLLGLCFLSTALLHVLRGSNTSHKKKINLIHSKRTRKISCFPFEEMDMQMVR